jgi:hypothetical protein
VGSRSGIAELYYSGSWEHRQLLCMLAGTSGILGWMEGWMGVIACMCYYRFRSERTEGVLFATEAKRFCLILSALLVK